MVLARRGTGVSYHEFDVALSASSVDSSIAYPVGRHRAFTRNHLNVVMRKP